jgi:hypothetical protein
VFLPVNDQINGVTVRQMTLRQLVILFQVHSPVLVGGTIGPEHVGQLLWILSPQYDAENAEQRRAYLEALIAQYPPQRFRLFYRAIRRYIWRHFHFDRPPRRGNGIEIAASYAAGIIHKLRRAGHSEPDDQIMELPIARIFQYMKWIEVEENPRTPQFNALQSRCIQLWQQRREKAA